MNTILRQCLLLILPVTVYSQYADSRMLKCYPELRYETCYEPLRHPGVKTAEIKALYFSNNDSYYWSKDTVKEAIEEISRMSDLRYLKLSGIAFSGLLPKIIYLKYLRILDLSDDTSLVTFSPEISMLKSVIEMNLTGCSSLKDLRSLIAVDQLKVIKLSALKSVPEGLPDLTQIETLEISSSPNLKWDELVTGLQRCPKLKKLILDGNGFTHLPKGIEKLNALEELSLNDNPNLDWETESRRLSDLRNLRILHLSGDFSKGELPGGLKELKQLEGLDLSKCLYQDSWLKVIAQLKLRSLDLSGCQMVKVPENIDMLDSLVTLMLGDNPFRTLPASFRNLTRLCSLDLSNETGSSSGIALSRSTINTLSDLPLKYLDLSNCHFTKLPSNIGKLKVLEELWLDGTEINKLPGSFSELSSLRYLNMKQVGTWKLIKAGRTGESMSFREPFKFSEYSGTFQKLKKLEVVDIRGNLSFGDEEQELKSLKIALPHCKIITDAH